VSSDRPAAERAVFVDVVGGVAGDMLLAALLDAGASEAAVRSAVEAVLPGRFRLSTEEVTRAGLRARHLQVEEGPATAGPQGLEGAGVPFPAFRARVEHAVLPEPVRAAALAAIDRLGSAEGAIHGVAVDGLTLHDLGDDDTLLDVVGVAAALDSLGALAEDGRAALWVSSLPAGAGGRVLTGHGELPLPTPVTLELLRGFDLRPGGQGEHVTPTGAAILAALGRPSAGPPPMSLAAVGTGAGTRDPEGWPNVVRVWLGEPAIAADDRWEGADDDPEDLGRRAAGRQLVLLEANLDDLSPELVADAADALRAAGALDVWSTPAQMKKSRPGVVLSALCEPSRRSSVARAFFEASTTFGVRATTVHRAELERRVVRVEVPEAGGSVRVKIGMLEGRVVSAKPEHDDVAELAAGTGQPVRWVHEAAAAAARALRLAAAGDEP
jgi:pyridinium-3,5-bisthiocarboxylic acid mononucleotide nickel chelatase